MKPAPKAKTTNLRSQAIASILLATSIALGASACVNSKLPKLDKKSNPSASPSPGISTAVGDQFTISEVVVGATNGQAAPTGATPVTTIFFDPSRAVPANTANGPAFISNHCSANAAGGQASAKPCVCQFTWSELNASTGNNIPFTRTIQTSVVNAQQSLVTCNAPDVFNAEIPEGTTIRITILPGPGSSEVFTSGTFSYVKPVAVQAGDFRDQLGRSFINVMHYACYEQFQRGASITSKIGTRTNSQSGEPKSYPQANQFCVQRGGGTPAQGCDTPTNTPQSNFSSQAFYYNFFVRSTDSGNVNLANDRYTCPQVLESLYNSDLVGGRGRLWPRDTTFALSLSSSPDFNVGVNAFVELANGGGDPIARNSKACNSTTVPASNSTSNGFVLGCLGFAKKPNTDGTCPSFRDSSGSIRFTYRLRRFVALYPPLFEVDGRPPTQPQPLDTIYVLDRPVQPPAGSDPLRQYTMRGPKPCPFALLDQKGVLGNFDPLYNAPANGGFVPTYAATNNPGWNGTNVDGLQFPNFDSANSCSAAIPLAKIDANNPDQVVFSVGTVNSRNPVLPSIYVRPIRAWAPHYEEDTEFEACAPQASPFRDPPLHFSKDLTTGNVSWCAESYPSQNDHVAANDRVPNPTQPLSGANAFIGHMRPYTSHASKNSASAVCTSTIPLSIPGVDVQNRRQYPLSRCTPTWDSAHRIADADDRGFR